MIILENKKQAQLTQVIDDQHHFKVNIMFIYLYLTS
jgi:hypothetical protein